MSRTFVRAMLTFLKSLVQNLHYSFGEPESTKGYEIAHVVAPLFSTMDKVVITPRGENPPRMGTPFPDDLELRKIRLDSSRCNEIRISREATYSFSLNSNNIVLPLWEVQGIPMMRNLSINSFTGDGPFSLVAYVVPRNENGVRPQKHSYNSIKYILNLQIAQIDPGDFPEVEFKREREKSVDFEKARRNSLHFMSSVHALGNITQTANIQNCNDESRSSSGEEENEFEESNGIMPQRDLQVRNIKLFLGSVSSKKQTMHCFMYAGRFKSKKR